MLVLEDDSSEFGIGCRADSLCKNMSRFNAELRNSVSKSQSKQWRGKYAGSDGHYVPHDD